MTCTDKTDPSQGAKRPALPRRATGWVLRWSLRMLCVVAVVFFLTFLVLSSTPVGKWLAGKMLETPAMEELTQADAIVILGGDSFRAVAAAELYHRGLAPRVIVSADSVRMLATLKTCGLDSAMVEVEDLARATADHPRTIQTLPGITPESRLILVTSMYHPARVEMIFKQAGYTNFQIYSKDSQWWRLFRDKSNTQIIQGIHLMYELVAYAKDRLL